MRCKGIKKKSLKKRLWFFFFWCYSVIISIAFGINLKVHAKNPARKAAQAAELLRFIKFLAWVNKHLA